MKNSLNRYSNIQYPSQKHQFALSIQGKSSLDKEQNPFVALKHNLLVRKLYALKAERKGDFLSFKMVFYIQILIIP